MCSQSSRCSGLNNWAVGPCYWMNFWVMANNIFYEVTVIFDLQNRNRFIFETKFERKRSPSRCSWDMVLMRMEWMDGWKDRQPENIMPRSRRYTHTGHECTHTLSPHLQRNTPAAKDWAMPSRHPAAKIYGILSVHSITSERLLYCTHTVTHPCCPTPDTNKNCVHFLSRYVRRLSELRNQSCT